jgi:uroporphyrinogen-III decarboxylase
VRLHICGKPRCILEGVRSLGCEIMDIDYPVAMDQAHSLTGAQQVLTGNLDPVRDVRNGTPESIAKGLEALQPLAGANWVVAAGCEIVRDTAHDNLHAMVEFARTHRPIGIA